MKLKHNKVSLLAATLATFGSLAGEMNAAVIMSIAQIGSDVVMSYSGSLVTTGLAKIDENTSNVGTIRADNLYAGVVAPQRDYYPNSITVVITGSPTLDTTGGVVSGDSFAIWLNSNSFWISDGYSSGSPFNGSVTWSGTTLAEMGLTPEVTGFTATLNNGSGDTISLTTTAVPEPSSSLLIGIGALGLISRRRRTHKGEQAGSGQPATRSVLDFQGGDKPQPESEGRSR